MNTSKILPLSGTVNVTIHKNYFKQDDSSYAKVQRTTAGMNNVIATILNKSKLFDEATLVASVLLFKESILDLISQGFAVNLFELGTLYPNIQGSISSLNPDTTEIPALTLGFSPSQEALSAVSKAEIVNAQKEESLPVISSIEDLSTHKTDFSVTVNMPIRIKGRRVKIAGDSSQVGLFFAKNDENGFYDKDESNWIRVKDENFFKNTSGFLEFILKEDLIPGQNYTLIIKTAAGRGASVNKTIRTLVFDKVIKVA